MSNQVGPPQSELAQGDAPVSRLHERDSRPALTLDIEAYRKFVEDEELTEAQQRQLLTTVWEIMVGFLDLGFDFHPVQQVINDTKTLEVDSPSVVGLESISTNEQAAVAGRFNERAESVDS